MKNCASVWLFTGLLATVCTEYSIRKIESLWILSRTSVRPPQPQCCRRKRSVCRAGRGKNILAHPIPCRLHLKLHPCIVPGAKWKLTLPPGNPRSRVSRCNRLTFITPCRAESSGVAVLTRTLGLDGACPPTHCHSSITLRTHPFTCSSYYGITIYQWRDTKNWSKTSSYIHGSVHRESNNCPTRCDCIQFIIFL